MKRAATVLQSFGAVVLSAAGWLVAPPVGLAVAGVSLLAFGLAVERGEG